MQDLFGAYERVPLELILLQGVKMGRLALILHVYNM